MIELEPKLVTNKGLRVKFVSSRKPRRATKRAAGTRTKRASVTAFPMKLIWLLLGLLGGIIIATTLFLSFSTVRTGDVTSQMQHALAEKASEQQAASIKPSKPITQAKKPKFDFYTVLPNLDSSNSTKAAENKNKQKPTPPPKPKKMRNSADNNVLIAKYLIQAGSFRKVHDADTMKAQLILEGFDSRIDKVALGKNGTWYRVLIGPYDSEKQAIQQQQILAKQNIEGVLILDRPN